ncbi:hypothetical protein HDU93_007166 [Gonapodya sp. JEL0774]|nr:hypothetical protein HDU93_007166 [Gonapodya sp. JEL0774]
MERASASQENIDRLLASQAAEFSDTQALMAALAISSHTNGAASNFGNVSPPVEPPEPVELYISDEQVADSSTDAEDDIENSTSGRGSGQSASAGAKLAERLQCAICNNVPLRYFMFAVRVPGALKPSYCASCLLCLFRQSLKSRTGTTQPPPDTLPYNIRASKYASKCPFTRTDVGPRDVVEDLRRDEEVEGVVVRCRYYESGMLAHPLYRLLLLVCRPALTLQSPTAYQAEDPAAVDPSHPSSSSSLLRAIIASCTPPTPPPPPNG